MEQSELSEMMNKAHEGLVEAQCNIRVMDKKEYVEAMKNLEKQLAEEAE